MTQGPTLVERDAPPRTCHALEAAGVHPLLARLFAGRGVRSIDELSDDAARLLPPATLKGAREAAVLLADTIDAEQRICIVADYDCDGATACAVAVRGLAMLGARREALHYVVPDRRVHGYGLTPAIAELARAHAPALLITVDNGIASVDGVARAHALGMKVLVTDHHLPAVDSARRGAPARGRGDRQPQSTGLRVREQVDRRRRRDVLRAAGAARVAARARPLQPRPRSRGWTACSTWWRWAPWPTWSSSTPTTAGWWRRA